MGHKGHGNHTMGTKPSGRSSKGATPPAGSSTKGQPMAKGESVVDDGSEGKALQLSGYSIIQAEDMASAKELVDGHPFLSDKTGAFSVEVFELLPVPGM